MMNKKAKYALLTLTLVVIAIIATYLTTNSINCSQKSERACLASAQCTAVYINEAEKENEEFLGGPFGSLLPFRERPIHCRDLQIGRLENFIKNK